MLVSDEEELNSSIDVDVIKGFVLWSGELSEGDGDDEEEEVLDEVWE